MAIGKGVNVTMGVRPASTWGTSVAVNAAGYGFRAKTWSFKESAEPLVDDSYNAQPQSRQRTNTGRVSVSGSFTLEMKYEGCHRPIALFLGTAGVPTGGGADKTHTYRVKNDMSGVFATICWYDGIKTHEIDSAKFTKMTLSGTAGRIVEASFDWIGRRWQTDTATNGSLSSLTEPSNIDYVEMDSSILDYEIAAQGGSPADWEVNKWSLTFEREYPVDDRAYTSTHAPYMREPDAGALTVKGQVQIPYEAITYPAVVVPGTIYEGEFDHILSAAVKEFKVKLPSMKFSAATLNPSGKAGIPLVLDFDCFIPDAAPSGFTYRYPYIVAINQDTADQLA